METASNPTYDVSAEEILLGALLWNSNKFLDVEEIIDSSFFYVPRNKEVFEAMLRVVKGGGVIDTVTVKAQLENVDKLSVIGGIEYLEKLIEASPVIPNIESYAKIIEEKFTRRRLHDVGTNIVKRSLNAGTGLDDILSDCEQEIFDLTQRKSNVKHTEISAVIPDLVHEIVSVSENSGAHRGVSSGYPDIDKALSGFHKSDLIILAARPSVGKTALALDIARRSASDHKTSVGIMSLEMSTSQLIERMLSVESNLDAWRMRTGKLGKNSDDFQTLTSAADRLSNLSISVDDRSSINTIEMRSSARRMKKENGINLLIVDYLQLISPYSSKKSDSMVLHITEVSRTLKQIARELSIPVIALSQLSRDIEKRAGKPRLSDLRDSGSIEQDADVVMFLHRNTEMMHDGDDKSPIPTELLIEKHRNGPTGIVKLQFNRSQATYVEVSKGNYGPNF